eukprot:5380850-Prymnesium_polylepis.1
MVAAAAAAAAAGAPAEFAHICHTGQQDLAEREAQWNAERSALKAQVADLEAALKQEKSDAAALAKSVREAFEQVEAWQSDNQLPSHITRGSEKWSREHGWLHWHEPEKEKTSAVLHAVGPGSLGLPSAATVRVWSRSGERQ